MFVDQGEPEPRAVARAAASSDRATGEALEDEEAFFGWDPRAVVLDCDPHVSERLAFTLGL